MADRERAETVATWGPLELSSAAMTDADQVLVGLEFSPKRLGSEEAARRLGQVGPNALRSRGARELTIFVRHPETIVTDDHVVVTAMIARAHLNEFPDYYSQLAVMEAEAEADWPAHGP